MSAAAWFEAAHPAPDVTCLGLRLRPYCLGHQILLRLQGSPLAEEQIPIALLEDPVNAFKPLALAVMICTQTYEAAQKSLRSRVVAPAFVRIWAQVVRARMMRPRAELAKFHRYRTAALWIPDVPDTNKPGKTRSLSSPWELRYLAALQSIFGYTESQALNMPLSRATALYTAWLEQEGKLDLDQHDELFDALEEFEAEGKLPTIEQLAEESKQFRAEVIE